MQDLSLSLRYFYYFDKNLQKYVHLNVIKKQTNFYN